MDIYYNCGLHYLLNLISNWFGQYNVSVGQQYTVCCRGVLGLQVTVLKK